jgi:hypothetical protein
VRQQQELAEWRQQGHGQSDPAIFLTEILPGLSDVPLSQLVEVTGLSEPYCSRIRRGLAVPHIRHWAIFQRLANS